MHLLGPLGSQQDTLPILLPGLLCFKAGGLQRRLVFLEEGGDVPVDLGQLLIQSSGPCEVAVRFGSLALSGNVPLEMHEKLEVGGAESVGAECVLEVVLRVSFPQQRCIRWSVGVGQAYPALHASSRRS